MDMSTESKWDNNGKSTNLPQWADCDLFCIHDYAGTGASPCGWRGHLCDVHHSETGGTLLCPRCGSATLFRIPLDGG
jgi:hypothetical protein